MVLFATVVILAGFGAQLHSPPSFMDTVTGATPRAKRAAQENAELEGNYVFGINPSACGLEDKNVRVQLKNSISGKKESSGKEIAAKILRKSGDGEIYIYVSASDYALKRYAKNLCSRLNKAGADLEIKEYNNTMLRSRILSGCYQTFLVSDDLLDAVSLKKADTMKLNSEDMTEE